MLDRAVLRRASAIQTDTAVIRGVDRADPGIQAELVRRPRGSFREVVRQQWNFNPSGSAVESDDYRVDLKGVTTLSW